jgi:lipid A 3-O-deacylase
MEFKYRPLTGLKVRRKPWRLQTCMSRIAGNAGCLFATINIGLAQNEAGLELQPPPAGVWQDGIGNGFQAGTLQAGFSVGAGFGVAAFGSRVAHDLSLASVNLGWMTGVKAQDHWYRGNWEIAGELSGGTQYRPEYRYIVGLTPLLRYNFATGTRWVPFLNGGTGVMATDMGPPDLGSTFQFASQGGLGTHYFLRDDLAVTMECRTLHISNAGIRQPNHGVNTQMFYLGLNWFF